MNSEQITILIIVIFAIIFLLGFIVHLIYLFVTPSNKLSIEDFQNKKSIFRLLKKKK